ncbi:hypothetical protein ACOMD4_33930 [Streptomyces anulatus]|uniref:hypothetical protein n=1 Tax=Streptomyces anulatus TaxID=1892 RepID=UPI003B7FF4DC
MPSTHRTEAGGKTHRGHNDRRTFHESSWGAEAVNAAVMRTVAAVSAGTVVAVTG